LGHGLSSDRPTKKRRRPSTPPDDLSSDREHIFYEAETEVEKQIADADEDYLDGPGGMDIPERRSKRVLKRLDSS
jgi:hypothetical protein